MIVYIEFHGNYKFVGQLLKLVYRIVWLVAALHWLQ